MRLTERIVEAGLSEAAARVFGAGLGRIANADGEVEAGEARMIQMLCAALGTAALSTAALSTAALSTAALSTAQRRADAPAVRPGGGAPPAGDPLADLEQLWSHAELFLTACIYIAVVDGEYGVEEARLISLFAHRLGLSAHQLAELEGRVFEELRQRAAPR